MTSVEASSRDRRIPPPWIRRAIIAWWLTGAAIALTFVLVRELQSLLTQIVMALFLSFAIEPVVDKLERRGIGRGTATVMALLGVVASIVIFLAMMGTLIADQLNQLVDDLPVYVESAQQWLDSTVGIQVSADDLLSQLQPGGEASKFASNLAGDLLGFGTTIANVLFQVLTVTIFAYYFSADGPRLRRAVCSVFPPARQHEILRVWELAITKTGGYITSRTILAVISGTFHWVVFASLGLPSPIALGIWVGIISQFIPAIGTYLAGILPVLVAVGVEPSKALWVVAAIVVYQQIENYLLQPRITAQTLDMHPAIAIAVVLAGTQLFGVAGALLALPLVATLTAFSTAYIERHELVDNRLIDQIIVDQILVDQSMAEQSMAEQSLPGTPEAEEGLEAP